MSDGRPKATQQDMLDMMARQARMSQVINKLAHVIESQQQELAALHEVARKQDELLAELAKRAEVPGIQFTERPGVFYHDAMKKLRGER